MKKAFFALVMAFTVFAVTSCSSDDSSSASGGGGIGSVTPPGAPGTP